LKRNIGLWSALRAIVQFIFVWPTDAGKWWRYDGRRRASKSCCRLN
jgi:hypothetical protein